MKIKKIGIAALLLFLAVLTAATVYSRTAYQYGLPQVTLEAAKSGVLPGSDSAEQYDCIVPKPAVLGEPSGVRYILLVQQQDGAWGKEYVCAKRIVGILAETERYVAISGSAPAYPLVSGSDKPVQDGSVVRLYP